MHEAYHIATTGRPGPVLVDLPKDITAGICRQAIESQPQLLGYYGTENKVRGNRTDQAQNLQRAADLINRAEKPIVYAGQGAMHAPEELKALVQQANIPITTSLQVRYGLF